jgi:hypothetical protein
MVEPGHAHTHVVVAKALLGRTRRCRVRKASVHVSPCIHLTSQTTHTDKDIAHLTEDNRRNTSVSTVRFIKNKHTVHPKGEVTINVNVQALDMRFDDATAYFIIDATLSRSEITVDNQAIGTT